MEDSRAGSELRRRRPASTVPFPSGTNLSDDDTTACLNLDFILLSIKELELLEKVEKKLKKVEHLLECGRGMRKEAVQVRIVRLLRVYSAVLHRLHTSQKKWETLKGSMTIEDVDGLPRQSLRRPKLKALFCRLEALGRKAESFVKSSPKRTNLNGAAETAQADDVCVREKAVDDGASYRDLVDDKEWGMEEDTEVVVTFVSPSLQKRVCPASWTDSAGLTFQAQTAPRVNKGWRILLIAEEEFPSLQQETWNSNGATSRVAPEVIDVW